MKNLSQPHAHVDSYFRRDFFQVFFWEFKLGGTTTSLMSGTAILIIQNQVLLID